MSDTDMLSGLTALATNFGGKDKESEAFKAALVVLSSMHVGANDVSIADFTGYSPDVVTTFGDRLRAAKVWRGDAVNLNCDLDDDHYFQRGVARATRIAQGLIYVVAQGEDVAESGN